MTKGKFKCVRKVARKVLGNAAEDILQDAAGGSVMQLDNKGGPSGTKENGNANTRVDAGSIETHSECKDMEDQQQGDGEGGEDCQEEEEEDDEEGD